MDLFWGGSLSGVRPPVVAYPITFLGKLGRVRLFEEAAGERVEAVRSTREGKVGRRGSWPEPPAIQPLHGPVQQQARDERGRTKAPEQ